MQNDLNFICLSGLLERAPTARRLASGLPVANAKLLLRNFFRANGEVKERVSPISLVFYGDELVDQIRLCETGDRLTISGELVIRSTSPTRVRNTHEIVVRHCERVSPTLAGTRSAPTPEEPQKWQIG